MNYTILEIVNGKIEYTNFFFYSIEEAEDYVNAANIHNAIIVKLYNPA